MLDSGPKKIASPGERFEIKATLFRKKRDDLWGDAPLATGIWNLESPHSGTLSDDWPAAKVTRRIRGDGSNDRELKH